MMTANAMARLMAAGTVDSFIRTGKTMRIPARVIVVLAWMTWFPWANADLPKGTNASPDHPSAVVQCQRWTQVSFAGIWNQDADTCAKLTAVKCWNESSRELQFDRDACAPLAAAGDANAQFLMYTFGRHDQRGNRDSRAREWLELAAGHGHAPAQVALGALLITGTVGPYQPQEGEAWLRRAAASGNEAAVRHLGYLGAARAQGRIELLIFGGIALVLLIIPFVQMKFAGNRDYLRYLAMWSPHWLSLVLVAGFVLPGGKASFWSRIKHPDLSALWSEIGVNSELWFTLLMYSPFAALGIYVVCFSAWPASRKALAISVAVYMPILIAAAAFVAMYAGMASQGAGR